MPDGTMLRDTPQRFGLVSRGFHWGMAYLLLWQFAMAIGWRIFNESTMKEAAHFGPSHVVVGVLVFALVLPRVIWAVTSRRFRPAHRIGPMGFVARVAHGALYALMFAIPALGLLRAYGSGKGLSPFGLALIPATGRKIGWMVDLADRLHSPLGWTLACLIAGHVVMALVHAAILRDGTFARMTGPLRG